MVAFFRLSLSMLVAFPRHVDFPNCGGSVLACSLFPAGHHAQFLAALPLHSGSLWAQIPFVWDAAIKIKLIKSFLCSHLGCCAYSLVISAAISEAVSVDDPGRIRGYP